MFGLLTTVNRWPFHRSITPPTAPAAPTAQPSDAESRSVDARVLWVPTDPAGRLDQAAAMAGAATNSTAAAVAIELFLMSLPLSIAHFPGHGHGGAMTY